MKFISLLRLCAWSTARRQREDGDKFHTGDMLGWAGYYYYYYFAAGTIYIILLPILLLLLVLLILLLFLLLFLLILHRAAKSRRGWEAKLAIR